MTRLGADRMLELAEAALAVDGVDEVEALLLRGSGGLTRFAGNRIHQSTATEDLEVRVRAVVDGNRVGVASTHDASPTGARQTAARAREVAHAIPPDPGYPGMPGPAAYPDAGRYDEATAATAPAERAELIAGVIERLPDGVTAAGTLETGELEVAVANSRGVRGAYATTRATFSILADAGSGTGYAEAVEPALAELPVDALGGRAAEKAVASRDPRDLQPGAYPVILEPAAVATMIEFLGYLGFGAKAYHEGRSFLTGRLGSQVADPSVTILDDGLAPDTIGAPFDFEGVPKQVVTLIDRGVAANLLYDWRSAEEHGRQPTGHGLPAPSSEGAYPLNLTMRPGGRSAADLAAGLERGLLVTRFHYTNVVHPMETSITGMTRDGTFLVEDGKIVGGVKNLRFTQSILGALSAVRGISRETELIGEGSFTTVRCPTLSIASFNFSSATTF
ncbi:MAG TPA: TldD/PmbA family protein [Actinomycetes bacterium]|nr:TldD/PmbA family protein [Actinomycetes bacterium]